MVALAYTQVDTILGKLTNGRKIVMTELTFSAGDAVGTITVRPLRRIISWTLGLTLPATDTFVCANQGTILNQITITPSGDCTGDVLNILSVGE